MSITDPNGYYSILELKPDAADSEIKSAYYRKAKQTHPDQNSSSDAKRKFQLVHEAYSILKDPSLRAKYDTSSIETSSSPTKTDSKQSVDPIICSCCGALSAQPRYVIFYEVHSIVLMTTRHIIQGIFCSTCAKKKAVKSLAGTWLAGWWGIPYGPLYSIEAIFINSLGGKKPSYVNAKLLAHQAWYFATTGEIDIGRATAVDALNFVRKPLGKEPMNTDEKRLESQIQILLNTLNKNAKIKIIRLQNSWTPLRRPICIQLIIALIIGSFIWRSATDDSHYTPSKTYYSNPPRTALYPPPSQKPIYARPITAPNGKEWPLSAGYIENYPRENAKGLSSVTIDNSRNNSDVFVKLVFLNGLKNTPVRTFFIPAYESFTLKNITAGKYDIRYQDLDSGNRTASEEFTLEEIKDYSGTQFSNITITLYKVQNGNMRTHEISESDL